MKILRYISALVFFQIIGALIAIPLLYASLSIGNHFGAINILFMAIPILIALGTSLYLSSKFFTWLKKQPEKKQLYVGVPLAIIFALVLVAEAVIEKDSNGVFTSTKRFLAW